MVYPMSEERPEWQLHSGRFDRDRFDTSLGLLLKVDVRR